MRPALHLLLAALLVTPALADDTVDLRKADSYQPKVGDKVRHTKSDTQLMHHVILNGGNPMQDKKEERGYEAVWVDEVQAVSEDGKKATRTLRTYERLAERRRGGLEEVAVTGVKVLLTVDAEGKHAYAAAEGSAPIPPALEAQLRAEVGKGTKKAAAPADDASDPKKLLVPAEPQKVGATWDVDPVKVCAGMGLGKAEDLVLEQSSVKGTFVRLEAGQAHVKVDIKLALKRMKDLPLAEVGMFEMTMELALAAAGDSPAGVMQGKGSFKAKPTPPNMPEGMTMTMDMTMDTVERRERVE